MADTALNEAPATAEQNALLALQDIPQPLQRILHEAIHENASDVHFDPVGNGKAIRFRVDGVVHEKELLGSPERSRLVNQVKVNAGMSPDRTVAPLEGLMLLAHDETSYDVRVTIVPVLEREAVHLRFVASKHGLLKMNEIGLCDPHMRLLERHLRGSKGLILITGATGSGKTTTMYALISAMDLHSQIAASIEDPVEFRIPYLRQVQVSPQHGLNMQEGLRTLLRMDPEAIAVGEVRDQTSAMIAGRASLTGRLVLATLHAPSACTAISALQNLSVPRHVLGHALRVIITQDLVPRLCEHCRHEEPIADSRGEVFEKHNVDVPDVLYVAEGCDKCYGYGHAGRTGVFELLEIDSNMRYALAGGLSQREMATLFRERAAHSLLQDALRKAGEGIISFESVERLNAQEELR